MSLLVKPRLSQLQIDISKNWGGYKIENLGAADSDDDAVRRDQAIPSPWVPLVSYKGSGANSYTQSWVGNYGYLRILFQTTKADALHDPRIRLNGNVGNVYDSVWQFTNEGGGPWANAVVGTDRLQVLGTPITNPYPLVYSGVLFTVPSPPGCSVITYTASKELAAATVTPVHGVHNYGASGYITSITIFEQGGAAFNLWLVVLGMALPS